MASSVAFFACIFFSCAISVSFATEQGFAGDYFSPFETEVRLENAYYKVEQAQRIILKTGANTSVADVLAISKNIQKAQLIFSGDSFNYYLLLIESSFDSTYQQVLASPLALLAQPDIYLKRINEPFATTRELKAAPSGVEQNTEKNAEKNAEKSTGAKPVNSNHSALNNAGQKVQPVNIAIIDDGILLKHPALAHITPLFSYDVQSQSLNAQHKTKLDGHGTRIAGVLFAKDANNRVSGMAADANLIAIRSPNGWTSDTLLSLQLAQLAGADLINCSWDMVVLVAPIADAIRHLSMNGREGKGTVVVFSAGNDGQHIHKSMVNVAASGALLVGALDTYGAPLVSSNYGEGVNVWASGQKVITLSKRGGYSVVAGTSLAAAKTTGMAAQIMAADPSLAGRQIIAALTKKTETDNTTNNGKINNND